MIPLFFAMNTIFDFDEINRLTDYSYRLNLENNDLDGLISDIESILINAYVFGHDKANEELGTNYDVDSSELAEDLYLVIEGKSFVDRVEEYYEDRDLPKIQRVVETETHRMLNAGSFDVGEQAESSGKTVYKKWSTMLDDKVRATHDYLEGMTIPLNEKFFTFDGDSAFYCGGFEKAENNVNCRCVIQLSAR